MKSSLILSLAVMLPLAVQQQSPASAPIEMSFASRLAAQYTSVKTLITRIADKMPADQYGFQPSPDVRTFAANIGHLVSSNVNQCGNLLGRKHDLMGQDLSKTLTTKADAVKAVADTFAFCDEYFSTLDNDASLTGEYFNTFTMRDGQRTPAKVAKGALISSFISHNSEMYGYMAVYLRLKGIVPPSSEPSPGRSGGAGLR